MIDSDLLARSVLRSVRPRPGFSAELEGALLRAPEHPMMIQSPVGRSHARWVVAGAAVAVSATGAVYWGLKRTRRAA